MQIADPWLDGSGGMLINRSTSCRYTRNTIYSVLRTPSLCMQYFGTTLWFIFYCLFGSDSNVGCIIVFFLRNNLVLRIF